ncbi:MAG: tryptophan synthase subunit alpha [Phycisphaerae bacterium]|jgi:tryptophan synthase alpha chain|nr:tryptophan synthase subunit alpha [Phycisphaerae bacterium]
MTRISEIFHRARQDRRGLVLPFLTAGYPSLEVLPALIQAMERAGAGAVEIGIPFSDPIADGPVIAASMHEALTHGVTPQAIFQRMARDSQATRGAGQGTGQARTAVGLIAMVSVSIVERAGEQRFVDDVAAAGMDGLIVPDADLERTGDIVAACDRHGLSCSFLVAPTSTPERIRTIVRQSRGFVYLLARAGVTGERNAAPAVAGEFERQVERIRQCDPAMPIAAGFGITTPDHVQAVLRHVDGAIVGSALVRRMSDAVRDGRDPVADAEAFVGSLVAAADAAMRA